MSTRNPLSYTNLTYQQILDNFRSKLNSDPRFENFRESAIATTVFEMMAASLDMINYNIERQAEESYLDTARRMSSAILLSRMIGYAPVRPIPASTSLTMTINGPLPAGLTAGSILYLNRKTEFNHDGLPFILRNTYQYEFTADDITNGVGNANFSKVISYGLVADSTNYDLVVSAESISADRLVDIELLQGEIKQEVIQGDETDLVGIKFQKYKIQDTSFSNLYGEEDLGYDPDTGEQNQEMNLTRVAIANYDVFAAEEAGTLTDYSDFYDIDRRTLLRPDSPLTETYVSAVPITLIRTARDGAIEIEFGDNIFAKKGLESTSDNIYVQYLSTQGAQANKVGVIGDTLTTDELFTANSIDVTSNLSFTLKRNVLNGADLEDIESIKLNAPSIFSSLDRCVTRKDYVSFLKSLTSPINIKNAVAWGEQEEAASVSGSPIKKLFNVVLFTALGSLYDVDSDTHAVKMYGSTSESTALSGAVLDSDYSPYTTLPSSYLNVLIKELVTDEINVQQSLPTTSNIYKVYSKLNPRSQVTVRNVYMTPIINEFDLTGTVYLKKLSNLNYIRKNINNSIYEWLNTNADFETPIFISKINEIINSDPNVVYSDVAFEPYNVSGTLFDFDYPSTIIDADISAWTPVAGESLSAINNVYATNINSFMSTMTYHTFSDIRYVFDASYQNKNVSEAWYNNITERNFYNGLIKDIYTDLKALALVSNGFADSTGFNNTVVKLHNSFDYAIKWAMLDSSGNIANFSLSNQIAKVRVNLTYVYR